MKVLVAGGAGYLGSRLVPELLRCGHEPTILDSLIFGHHAIGCIVPFKAEDIRNVSAGELNGFDAVINLAGLSNDPTADFAPEWNWLVNTEAAIRLAESCIEAGVPRYILASSCSCYYTDEPSDEIFTEESAISPKANYSRSKFEAESGVLPLAGPGFTPVALRMGTIHGYSPRMRYDLVVNTMLKDAFLHNCITVHGGSQWRPLLSIEGAVEAYVRMLDAPAEVVSGKIFNVLTCNCTVSEIAFMLRGWLQDRTNFNVTVQQEAGSGSRSYRVSGEKFTQAFSRLSRNDGFRAIWEHLNSGINPEDPIYHNIRWLKRRAA